MGSMLTMPMSGSTSTKCVPCPSATASASGISGPSLLSSALCLLRLGVEQCCLDDLGTYEGEAFLFCLPFYTLYPSVHVSWKHLLLENSIECTRSMAMMSALLSD